MANIALDSLAPNEACFEEASKSVKDNCTITIGFHVKDEKTDYKPVSFLREKDRFVIDPNQGSSNLAIVHALFPAEKIDSIQSALHFTVAMAKLHLRAYPILQNGMQNQGEVIYPYSGASLKPLLSRIINFYAAGDITNPDKIQSASNSALTREVLTQPHPPRAWLSKLHRSLLDPRLNLNMTPEYTRSRIQWLTDQLECMDQLVKPWVKSSAATATDPVDLALAPESDIYRLYVNIIDYLFNATELNPEKIIAQTDPIAARLFNAKDLPENKKDFFAFLQKKLTEFGTKNTLNQNLAARQKLNTLLAHMNSALNEHRSELLSLEAGTAVQKSIDYQVETAALRGNLERLVSSELKEAHLNPEWIRTNRSEIMQALLPHFKLQNNTGKPPRINIDSDGILKSIEELSSRHYVQKREYKIGALAILRYLLGENLSNPHISVWHQGKMTKLEVSVSGKGGIPQLAKIGEHLSQQIGKSVTFTERNLPWIEAGVGVTGLGITGTSVGLNGFYRSPMTTVGASVVGLGTGALTCNKLWKTRNNILSDLGCGAIAALGFGLAAQFLLPEKISNFEGMYPIFDANSGRNPVTEFGP